MTFIFDLFLLFWVNLFFPARKHVAEDSALEFINFDELLRPERNGVREEIPNKEDFQPFEDLYINDDFDFEVLD